MAMKKIRIGLAGLGTVGAGVVRILRDQRESLFQKTGAYLDVTAVSARSKGKKRDADVSHCTWVDDPRDLATHPNVDVVVEVMGGDGDPALGLVRAALEHKKPVVTANKALLAHHGLELAQLAEKNNVPLFYEAAVAGGIPIIKMLREGLAANNVQGLYGILNGTCNYILTTMENTGQGFADVLRDAQKLGYAEADPTLDVGGGDSGHKLVLLTALAFGCRPDIANLPVAGIENIIADDIAIAREFDYRIKLVGQACRLDDGRVLQMVSPSLVPKSSPLAHVGGVLNGIQTTSNYAGPSFIAGRGAGADPTASAVVADLVDVARNGNMIPVFGQQADKLSSNPVAGFNDWKGEFYLRVVVRDQPGVIADIAPILRDYNISIESLIQRGRSPDQPVSVVIFTHETGGWAVREAAAKIGVLPAVVAEPLIMPLLAI